MLPVEYGKAFPLDEKRHPNFLDEPTQRAVARRLAREPHGLHWPRSIQTDRLLRNLLSSQPLAFNLFGRFVEQPDGLLPWVKTIDPDATVVEDVRIEWAPRPQDHLGSGTAFDAWVGYRAGDAPRFVAVEVKYAEDLSAADKADYVPRYKAAVEALECWKPGTYSELNRLGRQQFMLNASLAQSLVRTGCVEEGRQFSSGHCVVVACHEDKQASETTRDVADRLADTATITLTYQSFDKVLKALVGTGDWVAKFRTRYLTDPEDPT
jgi:hypothetical protein